MNIQTPRPSAHQPWEQVRTRLDQNAPFSNMHDTPYYRDAVYDHFSKQEYQRRYRALREKMRELKLDRGRIGLVEIDARHSDYLPVNQYNVLRQSLPDAELVFTKGFMHELVAVHSEEELRCVRKAGVLCERAMQAMVARAKPGVPEYE